MLFPIIFSFSLIISPWMVADYTSFMNFLPDVVILVLSPNFSD